MTDDEIESKRAKQRIYAKRYREKQSISDEALKKRLATTELENVDDYRMIVVKIVRDTIKAIDSGKMTIGSGMRILTRVVDTAAPLLEKGDLTQRMKDIQNEIEEMKDKVGRGGNGISIQQPSSHRRREITAQEVQN